MRIPQIPDSAPFSSSQRAWLNGFFAAVLSSREPSAAEDRTASSAAEGLASATPSVAMAETEEEEFPWRDASLPLAERLESSHGRPLELRLMSAMAQLDCGACGYQCQSYAAALAEGAEKDASRCAPGGKETVQAVKRILAERPAEKPAAAPVLANGSTHAQREVASREQPVSAALVASNRLTSPESVKDTRHVVLDLGDSGLTYVPGDSLGVWPKNDPAMVNAVLRELPANGEELVYLPRGREKRLLDLLTEDVGITRSSPELALLLAQHASSPEERLALSEAANTEDFPFADDSPADLLARYPSARPPLTEFVQALPILQPRLYSISSSLKAHPGQVHLTVGVADYQYGGQQRFGVASHYLGLRTKPGEKIPVFVHASKFRLPSNPQTPVVMIGPGTGVAPFRAFLQERAAEGAAGPNWLFFGNPRSEHDYLYREEFTAFLERGVLTRLNVAFSRDQAEKRYVQHELLEHGAELWRWLQDEACVYLCGDAKRMAADVQKALLQVVQQHGGQSPEQAKQTIAAWSRSGRLQKDVY